MSLHDLHRPLGNTGLIVSPLGLGTVKLGRDQGVKYPNGFTIPDDAAARALLDQARALGIQLTVFFDEARCHGAVGVDGFVSFESRGLHSPCVFDALTNGFGAFSRLCL